MPEPGDYGRPPETPPQFQRNSPPRQGGTRPRQPQYAPRQDPQPVFTPGYPQPPRGQYSPPQSAWQEPAWQEPYPPQPQYAPSPYAPRPPRRPSWAARHKGLTVFLSLCGLVFVIGIAAAAASTSSSSPSAASAPPAQTQAAPPAPSRAAVATAKTVATFSGSGITNTAQFTVSSTWKLDYSFDCSNFGYAGNFIVMEDGGLSGAMNVNELAMSKTGSSYAYNDAGTHYIEVNSECSWTLKVIDEG
jgi:hypothetical protein